MKTATIAIAFALTSSFLIAKQVAAQRFPNAVLRNSAQLDSMANAKDEQVRAQKAADENKVSGVKQESKEVQRVQANTIKSGKEANRARKSERKAQKARRKADTRRKGFPDRKQDQLVSLL